MRWFVVFALGLVAACGARSALNDHRDAASGDAAADVSVNDVVDASTGDSCAFEAALPVWTTVRAGFDHACAALPTGVVKCWGDNSEGELGDGTFDAHDAAVAVPGLAGVTAIAS